MAYTDVHPLPLPPLNIPLPRPHPRPRSPHPTAQKPRTARSQRPFNVEHWVSAL
ncbi:hypothetical protein J1614_008766 [Plenodomus biglobosus]|nr:hypothetical protein J1614_008766 [Plenodomus biglobosus]